ncbi:MAG: hypothetical protein ABIQ01_08540 [Pseudolysinimonas sp.]
MTFRTLVIGAVAVVALSACSTGAPPVASPTPSASSSAGPSGPGIAPDDGGVYPLLPATHPHIQLQCPLISAIHYDSLVIAPADVDGVFVCTAEPWTDAPDGTPQLVQYVDRVDQDDIPALLTAYAVPDAPPTDDNCIMSLQDPLIVWLHVGEDITPVYAPRDGCGFPSAASAEAYHAVRLHRLLVAREKETRD